MYMKKPHNQPPNITWANIYLSVFIVVNTAAIGYILQFLQDFTWFVAANNRTLPQFYPVIILLGMVLLTLIIFDLKALELLIKFSSDGNQRKRLEANGPFSILLHEVIVFWTTVIKSVTRNKDDA